MKLSRRDFVHAGCAIVAAGPFTQASAWTHGSSGQTLRFVSANIAGPTSAGGLNVTTGTTTRRICRGYFSIGSGDISQLVLSWFAFYIFAFNGIAPCNGYTIESVSLEHGGTFTPITFSGGRTKIIAFSASDIQPDPLTITLTQGSANYLRFMLTFANPTTDISPQNGFQANPGGDLCAFDYDPAKVIITNGVDSTGPIAYTMTNGGVDGVDIKNNAFPMMPAILGKFVSGDPPTWVLAGDSAEYGTGETPGQTSSEGARGLSWAFYPGSAVPSSPAGAIANWNLGCNGGAAIDWGTGTPSLLTNYLKYFKYGLDEYGGNQFNIPASQAIWAQMYAAGIKYIIRTSLIPRTTSTDSWQTELNQTIVTGWGPSSGADTFEQGLKALVSPTLAYIDHTSIRGTTHWVFVVNGVAFYATNDGQHPSSQGYLFKCYGGAAVTTPGGTISQTLQALIGTKR